jgi:anaerobic magnesium-protoporphyrin IX monomethyl ester cyclase
VRWFSTERIIEEFHLLRDRYGAKEVAVWDDDFVADPDAAVNVCEELIRRSFDRPWSASACIETINRELLQIMQRAGCNYIAYGVESGSQRMLDRLKKRITKDEIREVIRMTKRLGVPIRAYFILGFPGETEAEMDETIEFARELDVDLASFTMFIPLPGTREYRRAQESGTFDPEYFFKMMIPEINFPDRPVYVPEGMDADRLMKIHQQAYNRVYLRPRVILRKLAAGLRSPAEFLVLFKGARTLLSNMLWRSGKL